MEASDASQSTPPVACAIVDRGGLAPGTVDPTLIVPWWSFTKTVIAAAALTLVRDGILSLDQPVDDAPYTLRQLLRHTAGLGDYGSVPEYHAAVARNDEPWSVPELLQRSQADQLHYAPGTGWRYSNIGYLKVRQSIERATNMPLDSALRQAVLEPLGISDAKFAHTRADLHGAAMGTAANYHPGWVYHGLLVGPLSAAARVLDRLFSFSLLPSELLQEMRSARAVGSPIPGRPWIAPGYGLGLMVELAAADGPIGHTGAGPGSTVAVYRRERNGAPIVIAAFCHGDYQGAVEHVAFSAA